MTADRIFLISLLLGFLCSLLLFVTGGKFRVRNLRLKRMRRRVSVPTPIGLLLVAFGLSGLLLRSFIAALAFGSIFYAAASFFLRRFLADTAEQLQGCVLNGTIGHVSLAIPENGIGRIAFIAGGKRVTSPARSLKGIALDRGTRILIVDLKSRIAIVEAL